MRYQDQNSSGTTLSLVLGGIPEGTSTCQRETLLGVDTLDTLDTAQILLDLSAPTMYAPASTHPHYITCK